MGSSRTIHNWLFLRVTRNHRGIPANLLLYISTLPSQFNYSQNIKVSTIKNYHRQTHSCTKGCLLWESGEVGPWWYHPVYRSFLIANTCKGANKVFLKKVYFSRAAHSHAPLQCTHSIKFLFPHTFDGHQHRANSPSCLMPFLI
jgi:hypothetical protein